MSTIAPRTALVVGGGASGIASAWYLRRIGIEPTLIEKSGVLSGRMGLADIDGTDIQFGGKNIGSRYHEFRRFCETFADVTFEHFGINSSRVANGKLVTIDNSRPLKALSNIVFKNRPGDLATLLRLALRLKRSSDDRSADSEFFDRWAGRRNYPSVAEVFGGPLQRSLVRPMVVRMNGAEPDEASMATFGSNLGSLMDSYDQLVEGIRPVLTGFATQFDVRTRTEVVRLLRGGDRVVHGVVALDQSGREHEITADLVVLALPAPQAAGLLAEESGDLSRLLSTVRYHPVGVVIAEYETDVFTPAVRAVVFEQGCPLSNAGAYGTQELNKVRYTFSGSAARPLLAGDTPEGELLAVAERALGSVLPVGSNQVRAVRSRIFDPGLCAMTRNHRHFLAQLDAEIATHTGLQLTGDYVKGPSLEACFRSAKERLASLPRPAAVAPLVRPARSEPVQPAS